MATDTQQQVEDLLADLAAVFDDESTDGQPDPEALEALADRADELVATTDLSELLVASGLGDEDEPSESLPAAVASGEPQNVARLRSLLTASKLSTAADDREERVVELQSLVETARGDSGPSAEAESTSDATGDDAETTPDAADATDEDTETTEAEVIEADATEAEATETDATEADATGADATEADATEAEATEAEEESDEESTSSFRELLESQLEETHGIFDQIPDLENLTGGLGEDDEEQTETVDEDESQKDQSTRKSEGTRWRPGGGKQRTTHSTIPSTGRRDIGRRAGRFSSVRGSTVSKR